MGKTALISPRDLLLPAGEGSVLEVEVERPLLTFLDPPVSGVEVRAEGIGSATTDARGVARMEVPARPAGVYRHAVRLSGDRWHAREAEALVVVVDKEKPVFICDLDMTVARCSPLGFILRSNDAVPPLDGAVEALNEIARTMAVVYLTARDHIFIGKSKAWLALKGFPEGPLYARKLRFWSANPRTHKIARLAELRASFPNLRWGVGDKRADAEAYAAHAVPAILLSPRPPAGLPPSTLTVPSWPSLLDLIKQPRYDKVI